MKLLVITEGGRVIGTQPVTPAAASAPAASAVLRAGRGQKVLEVEVGELGELGNARAIDALHRLVAGKLRPKKTARKKKRR
jgi:hypothetical protein